MYRIFPVVVWKNSCASFCLPCVDSRVVFVPIFVLFGSILVRRGLGRLAPDFFEGIMDECLVHLCG